MKGRRRALEQEFARHLVRTGPGSTSPVMPLLAPAPEGTVHLAISRDGRQLAFSVEQTETSIEEVAVGTDGSVAAAPRTLVASTTRRVLRPGYSPDGHRLLFRRLRSGSNTELVVVDA
jgi:hypothetical protein